MANKGQQQAWYRRVNEGQRAYELFLMYLQLGNKRSRRAVVEASGRKSRLVSSLMMKYQWVERAKAYDDWLVRIEEETIKRTLQKSAVKWAQREAKYREEMFELSDAMINRGRKMMSFPLTERKVTRHDPTTGNPVEITIKPVRWTQRDASSIIIEGLKLRHKSLHGMVDKEEGDGSDYESRLEHARAELSALQENINELADEFPHLTQEEILARLPIWVAKDWKVEADQLMSSSQPFQLSSGNTEAEENSDSDLVS
jgi:hypothetical protein